MFDASPDLRYQLIRAGVRQIDALVLTHEHMDHIGGIDELRALNFVDYPIIRPTHIYATGHVLGHVTRKYDYAFVEKKFRGVPELIRQEIFPPQSFHIKGIELIPITGGHSERFTVTGYRIGTFAYLTDFKTISDQEIAKLKGVEILVVNALRHTVNPSHFALCEALDLIERVEPRRSYLTHMSHDMGLHAEVNSTLPEGVSLAYDTLQIEVPYIE